MLIYIDQSVSNRLGCTFIHECGSKTYNLFKLSGVMYHLDKRAAKGLFVANMCMMFRLISKVAAYIWMFLAIAANVLSRVLPFVRTATTD